MRFSNIDLALLWAIKVFFLAGGIVLALIGCVQPNVNSRLTQSKIVLSGYAGCTPSVSCDLPATIEAEVIKEYFDRLGHEGLSAVVLVAQNDNIIFSRAYGSARDEPYIAMTQDTLLNLGSISKQFTAALVMQMVEEGKLSLDDVVGKFLPSAPANKANITIHQLLTHTSGLTAHDTGNDFDKMTKAEAIDRIFALEPPSAPGEQYRYSNAGYTLLAVIIEEVARESYLPLLKKRLFGPIGMNHTGTYGDDILRQNRTAYGYRSYQETDSFADAGPLQWGAMGNGEVFSTVDDMRRWMHALRKGEIVSESSLKRMWAPIVKIGPPNIFYGYGWRIRTVTKLGYRIEHGGAGHGGNANISYFPDHDLLFVILSNRIGINFVDGKVLGVKAPAAQVAESLIHVIAENDPTIKTDVSWTFD